MRSNALVYEKSIVYIWLDFYMLENVKSKFVSKAIEILLLFLVSAYRITYSGYLWEYELSSNSTRLHDIDKRSKSIEMYEFINSVLSDGLNRRKA